MRSASAICDAKCVGVTRLMLCAPIASSFFIVSINSSTVKSLPCRLSPEISLFWQNAQRSEQPVKKIVPLPRVPLMGGSSQ